MKKIVDFILKPFGQNLPLFLALWLLASSADAYYWSIHGNPVFGIYMAMHGFIQVYFIVLICGLLRGTFFKIVRGLLLGLGVINLIADACVQSIMWFSFTKDTVAIILGSNMSEASEFLPMYLNTRVLSFILIILLLVTAIFCLRKQIIRFNKRWMQWFLFVGLLLSIAVVTIRKSNNWESVFINKIYLFLSYDRPVDLTRYRSHPIIETIGEQPENIVLIIGESLSKRHCSLYGYSLETTPLMDAMAADSSLIVFQNVTAAYTNTVGAFKRMMSTYSDQAYEMNPSMEWYQYPFLEDIVSAAGYDTWWISNQSSSGIYDNIVATYADLSDNIVWVGPKGVGIGKSNPDGDVIPYVQSAASEITPTNKFFIIHLMGSHEGFETRYPKEYAQFSKDDYSDRPDNQRSTLAAYDNSVLYSDYVVSSLMHLFDDKEALVIFFPDHSLDIFDTDPTYAGHARTGDSESVQAGSEIPFVAYPTPSFKEKFPEIVSRLHNEAEQPFNTTYLIDEIAGLINIRLAK